MKNLNAIGLNEKKAAQLTKQLNVLLANYSIFYQNTRGYHWNIKGEKFFELHGKFEELYNDLLLKIDEVAERILTGERALADSRGLPAPPDAPVFGGAIFRVVSARSRPGEGVAS